LVVVALASMLIGVIVLRSPYTHANLWETVPPGYTRTSLTLVGQEVGDVELTGDHERVQEVSGFAVEQGRAVYLTRSCAICHGLDARGGPVGPSLAGSSLETVKRMVREGRGGMPTYTDAHLGDADLAALAAYLRGLEVARPDSEKIAALQRLTYDPSVPIDVLLKGKAAIRRSCGACHAQPGREDILRAFRSDAQAAGLVAEMVYETNLSIEDARAIAYYMLAVLNGADPVRVP
jgi:mono/diheme cytochrome c family protein